MKSRTFYTFWIFLVWLALLLSSKALRAEVDGSALWSFQFKSVSIADALKQITQTTGVKITPPNRLGNQVITKSYINQTVEHILRDIFRDMNCALVWSHGERGIDSVRILAFDEGGGVGARYSPDAVRSNIGGDPALRGPAQRQSLPQRRKLSSGKFKRESEPEDGDSEVSTEPEQEADDQIEAEFEEEGKESTSSSEESDEETPLPQNKMPEPFHENLEKGIEGPQSMMGQSEDEESSSSSPGEEESNSQQ